MSRAQGLLKMFLAYMMPIGVVVATIIVFLYTTFATITYVDAKHDSAISLLVEIRESVKRIEERVYQLQGDRGN